jgi:hypothetical protein
VAYFSEPTGDERPIDETRDLGTMLYDMEYTYDSAGRPTGRGTPIWYQPRLDRGIIHVPPRAVVTARMSSAASARVGSAPPQAVARVSYPAETPSWGAC